MRAIKATGKPKEAISRLQAAGFNVVIVRKEVARGWHKSLDRHFTVITLDKLEGTVEFAIDYHGDMHSRTLEGFWRATRPDNFECPGFTKYGMLEDNRFRFSSHT